MAVNETVKLIDLIIIYLTLKEFYPVMHLMTGPPPLDRNGGIWKVMKKELSNTIEHPRIMVQAFHFTTYNLSKGAWEEWASSGARSLGSQIRSYFKNGSIFVDSGGYQVMQGDKIDLSKWGIDVTQEGIYEIQKKYNPDIICNLDIPVRPQVDYRQFKELVERNVRNMKILDDIIKDDKSKVYYVIHGRNRIEIEYMYSRVKTSIHVESERAHFALGSQVPLISYGRSVVSENASHLSKLIEEDYGGLCGSYRQT